MSGTLIWTDRLRIERGCVDFHSYLQTLPWRSQAAKRRELRVNLRAASADVGTKEALRRLGNVRTMPPITSLLSTADRDLPGGAAICVFGILGSCSGWSNARIDAFQADVPHFSMMIWPPTSPGHRFAAWDRPGCGRLTEKYLASCG